MKGWFADKIVFLKKGAAIQHYFYSSIETQCGYAVFNNDDKIKLPNAYKCKRCLAGNKRRGIVG